MPMIASPSLSQVFGISLSISIEFEENDRLQIAASRVEDVQADRLWVAMPMRASMLLPLPVGAEIGVYCKREDATYFLPAKVIGRQLQPCPMLELRPLGEVQRRQQRDYVRLSIALVPVSAMLIDAAGAQTRLAATVVNLSAGGVLLRSRQPLAEKQKVQLVLELPAPGGKVEAVAEVLRVDARRVERGHLYEAGCRFLDLAESHRNLITKFIFRFQTRQAR